MRVVFRPLLHYSLRMNDKVIALIDMDCFYVQVNESRKYQIARDRNI